MAPPSEAEVFDALVRERDFNPFADRGWRTLEGRFSEWLGAGRPRRLLDVGCGTGQSRRIYAASAPFYVGIDLSQAALRRAANRWRDGGWALADACRLPFADRSFDVVAFSSVLHHIPERGAALAEARRVLVPGGWAFAFDPNLLHPAMALFRHPRSPLYQAAGVSPHERPLLPGHLRHDFQAAGFGTLRQRAEADIPYRSVAPRWLDAVLALYNAADWMMARSGLGRWFGSFVVTAGRRPEAS
jgi:SAM-dependent methyltransferase